MTTYEDLCVGTEYPPMTIGVTEELIQRYCRATGNPLPFYQAHMGCAAVAPMTVFAIWAFSVMKKHLGGVGKLVHASQTLESYRIVRAGTTLTVSSRLAEKYEKRGHRFFSLESTFTDDQLAVCARVVDRVVCFK